VETNAFNNVHRANDIRSVQCRSFSRRMEWSSGRY